jgi:hypothetical protein
MRSCVRGLLQSLNKKKRKKNIMIVAQINFKACMWTLNFTLQEKRHFATAKSPR